MSTEGPLATEVQGHLKRLRVERVYTLSMAVVALALAIRGALTGAIPCAIASLVLTFLVHARLIRCAKALCRGHPIPAQATSPDGGARPCARVATLIPLAPRKPSPHTPHPPHRWHCP